MNQDEIRGQLSQLRNKIFRDVMGIDVDWSLGKDSGAAQISSLTNALCRLVTLEQDLTPQEAQESQAPLVSLDYLPNFSKGLTVPQEPVMIESNQITPSPGGEGPKDLEISEV